MGGIVGIDVSEHNGTLDWAKIKAAGIQFAIIRSGYGTSHTDNQFKNNMAGAIAQSIPVGIYHFSYALDAAGAQLEAKYVLSLLSPYKDQLRLPVFFDFEYDTIAYAAKQGVTLGKAAFNAHTLAFCQVIQAAGYKAGTYYNLDYLSRYVDKAQLSGLPVWYAQYASKPSISDYDIWQYSSTYQIPGLSGNFDGNILKNTALLEDDPPVKTGWQQSGGKWYYFNQEGKKMANQWVTENGNSYYLGSDGAMVTNKTLKIDAEGKLVPAGGYYNRLRDVPAFYRETLDALIEKDILKGVSGQGEDMTLNLTEDAVRVLVLLDRAGLF